MFQTVKNTTIYHGDSLSVIQQLPSESIHCVITSPPYYGLRSYLSESDVNKEKEIGLEQTPQDYIANLVCLFREIRRVLRKEGTVWLNLGDSYNGKRVSEGLHSKDLLGIPWRVAFALQEDGWILRQDIIWAKRSSLPESVKDRCTKSHEYIFLLTKHPKYYFDQEAIKTKVKQKEGFVGSSNKRSVWNINPKPYKGAHFATFPVDLIEPCILAGCPEQVCKECNTPYIRTEKVIGQQITPHMLACGADIEGQYTGQATKEYEAGLAQNPSDTKRRILQSLSKVREFSFVKQCSCECNITEGGIILDPFGGSGTTGQAANHFNRRSIVIELNAEYLPLIVERVQQPYTPKKKKRKKKNHHPAQLSFSNLFEDFTI